jgi:CRISPR-associated protein Cmr3
VKADSGLDFSRNMPQRLLAIEVAGVFPVHDGELFLPAPDDAVAEPCGNGKGIKMVHRVAPQSNDGGCDFADDLPLQPVMLPERIDDFKPDDIPAWWPLAQYAEWLTSTKDQFPSDWFTNRFLNATQQEIRDHVCLDAGRGAAAEGQIFTTAGLNVTHLPRFGVDRDDKKLPLADRLADVTLSVRVTIPDAEFGHVNKLHILHPLGGERRLVHWHHNGDANLWTCPACVRQALASATQVRMVLATPAIFKGGWIPGWLNDQLEGSPPGTNLKLKLVGVSNGRWKAVSGWSLAKINDTGQLDPHGKPGPKPIRRMVPAGSVYFFTTNDNALSLADHWLKSVSDEEREQHDGFGLAVWGTW